MTAPQLQTQAEEAGIQLSLLAAYRALCNYRKSGGKMENSETRCFGVVASVLQDAIPGEHLTAPEIKKRASERNFSLHQATVYRVLAQLSTIGFVLAIDKGRQKFYEWKRDEEHHGHLTCIECGKTVEFHQDYLDEVGKQVCSRFGYHFARIEFNVRSLCERCRSR